MLSLALALALTPAQAATLTVGPGESFTTIGAAVTAANNGDTIEVVFGTYVENLSIGTKVLTLAAEDPRAQVTLVSGTEGAPIITVGTGSLTLDGFRLVGDVFTGDPDPDAEEVRICDFDLTTIETEDPDLPGITVAGGTLNVSDSAFTCLFTRTQGAAIGGDGTLTVTNTTFRNNAALYGGGGIDWRGTMTVSSSRFTENSAISGGGGAIQHTGGVGIVEASFLRLNTSFFEGGGVSMRGTEAILRHNTFQENFTNVFAGVGGGVYTNSGELDLWDNLFCGNFADMGAGLYTEEVPLVSVENNVFSDNWGSHYGGGMYLQAGSSDDSVSIINNTYIANEAGRTPPPDLTILVIGGGGAMMLDGTLAEFTNNIVARTRFGAGMGGVDGPNYIIGDLITMDYNLFYWNCDSATGCEPEDPGSWQDFSGDLAAHTLLPTNIFDNPTPVYVKDGEFDCFPDAFYPTYDSVVVDAGDPAITDLGGSRSDLGAYGGPDANVLDRDNDGYENIYDCDDLNASVHPGANEVCDFADNNCNGNIDEGFQIKWYTDTDDDGYGLQDSVPSLACAQPTGRVSNDDDCDDDDEEVNPSGAEVCNDVDDDCTGIVDDNLTFLTYYRDGDGDGYGDANLASTNPGTDPPSPVVTSCAPLTGYSLNAEDCDDTDTDLNPNTPEVCSDGIDNDCDGTIDEPDGATGATTWGIDADEDGYVAEDSVVSTCDGSPGTEYVQIDADDPLDCNDQLPVINPGRDERCNSTDDDCNGLIDDDALDALDWYYDGDEDTLGDPDTLIKACEAPGTGYINTGDDCDDLDELVGVCSSCNCASGGGTRPGIAAGFLLALALLRRREARR